MAFQPNFMRPIEEKHVSVRVDLMVWSTKMDLLAVSYGNGEVALHRLNWLKVWVLPPPKEGVTVTGIAWRPDGKVLAIGYSSLELYLIDVEKKEVINKCNVSGDITCLTWSEDRENFRNPEAMKVYDPSPVFLPPLPSLTRGPAEEHMNNAKGIEDAKKLNMLFVGISNGRLLISVFGLFPKAAVDVQSMLNLSDCTILDAGISKDQDVLLVTVKSGSSLWVVTIDTPLFLIHDSDLMTLAYRYGHITSCLDYMDVTLQNIIEGWENIMWEVDCKLRSYASKVPPGRVSCDFLDLLMFGVPTTEMSEFLMEHLKEKGLKNLISSTESTYNNIQGLVLKHLQAMGQSLAFQLDELCGLSRCPTFCQVMGLSEADAMAAFAATGSFMVKVSEVQQVIDESLNKYKAFFNWLFATILRQNEERAIPAEVSSMSPIDLQRIVDFLSNLEDNGRFNLDQLGQYLTDAPLATPPPPADIWANLLARHPSLAKLPQIVPHNTNLSLVQEARALRDQVTAVFDKTEKFIERHFKFKSATNIELTEGIVTDVLPRVTHSYVAAERKFLLAALDPLRPQGCYFLNVSAADRPASHTFIDTPQRLVDLQFYLPEVLSLLFDMGTEEQAGFAQVSDPGEAFSMRVIEGMVPSKFAVCGSRKVAVVLSESRRKVKIFEMDAEEEEEDEGMDTNNSLRDTDLDISGRS